MATLSKVLVEPNTSSRRNPAGRVTGSDGRIFLTDTDKIETIRVSGMGYHNAIIDYEPNSDYVVTLINNEVIENRTVIFQFEKWMMKSFSLLLTDDLMFRKKGSRT